VGFRRVDLFPTIWLIGHSDEGYYNWRNSTDNIYDGGSGEDFGTDLAIDTIDFGTFHLYPQQWAEGPVQQWGLDYIQQHIDSMYVHLSERARECQIDKWEL